MTEDVSLNDAADLPAPAYDPNAALTELQELTRPGGQGEGCFNTQQMLASLVYQRHFIQRIHHTDLSVENGITLADTNALLLMFLQGLYHCVSSLPAASTRFDQLEHSIAISALSLPFIQGFDAATGFLNIGMPTIAATPDSASELLRCTAAAAVTLWHFLNSPSPPPPRHTSDDACLLFCTMGLAVCTDADAIPRIQAEIASLQPLLPVISMGQEPTTTTSASSSNGGGSSASTAEEPPASTSSGAAPAAALSGLTFGLPQIRWLLHHLRSILCSHYACMHHVMGNPTGQRESFRGRRDDCLGLLKSVPSNPQSFVSLARCCMQLNQTSAALLFATKGLVVARQHSAHYQTAQLSYLRGVAMALGGHTGSRGSKPQLSATAGTAPSAAEVAAASAAAPSAQTEATSTLSASPAATAAASAEPGQRTEGMWTLREVRQCFEEGDAALAAAQAALPLVYHRLLEVDPDRDILLMLLLAAPGLAQPDSQQQIDLAAGLDGLSLEAGDEVAAITPLSDAEEELLRPALPFLYAVKQDSLPRGALAVESGGPA